MIQWNMLGVRYAITLALVVGLIMFGARLFNIADCSWAVISAVLCTELDRSRTHSTVLKRIIATLIGAIFALGCLLLVGPGYFPTLMSVIILTLLCHYLLPVGDSWKLTVATSAMILVISLQQHSIPIAEKIAIKRALEVLVGSITAGVVSLFMSRVFLK